jgi:hypothetical protein
MGQIAKNPVICLLLSGMPRVHIMQAIEDSLGWMLIEKQLQELDEATRQRELYPQRMEKQMNTGRDNALKRL